MRWFTTISLSKSRVLSAYDSCTRTYTAENDATESFFYYFYFSYGQNRKATMAGELLGSLSCLCNIWFLLWLFCLALRAFNSVLFLLLLSSVVWEYQSLTNWRGSTSKTWKFNKFYIFSFFFIQFTHSSNTNISISSVCVGIHSFPSFFLPFFAVILRQMSIFYSFLLFPLLTAATLQLKRLNFLLDIICPFSSVSWRSLCVCAQSLYPHHHQLSTLISEIIAGVATTCFSPHKWSVT